MREMPEIGLFEIYSVIAWRREYVLAYSTDKIRGKDAHKIRAAQGFFTPDGIGTITERADFKLGGGRVLQSAAHFKLRNTDGLKTTLSELGVEKEKPVTFGFCSAGLNVRDSLRSPEFISHYVFTGDKNDENEIDFEVVYMGMGVLKEAA
jgi:hypothetical protein